MLTLYGYVKIDQEIGFAKGDVNINSKMISFVVLMSYKGNDQHRKIYIHCDVPEPPKNAFSF